MTFIINSIKAIIDIFKSIITFPFKVYKDFKENLQIYELKGMQYVHGGRKGSDKFIKKYGPKTNVSEKKE